MSFFLSVFDPCNEAFDKVFFLPIPKFGSLGFMLQSLALSFFLSVSVLISINCVFVTFFQGGRYICTLR